LKRDSLVWTEGMPEWRPAGTGRAEMFGAAAPPPRGAPPPAGAAPPAASAPPAPRPTRPSRHEKFCPHRKSFPAPELLIGNSVFSMGFVGGLGAALKTLVGGEVTQMTTIVHDGRRMAYDRMVAEAGQRGGVGITGVSSELVQHANNIEFLSVGSCLHAEGG